MNIKSVGIWKVFTLWFPCHTLVTRWVRFTCEELLYTSSDSKSILRDAVTCVTDEAPPANTISCLVFIHARLVAISFVHLLSKVKLIGNR